MNIAVIGTGYVGLVVGACLADMGNNVVCVDNDIDKISNIEKGIIPIYEPGLKELVQNNVEEKRLSFTNNIDLAVKQSTVCFIAVGTPQDVDGSADLQNVKAVAKSIAIAMDGYKVIVDKSTVPVGTAEIVSQIIKENSEYPFDIVSNPEFLKQGNAVQDFLHPDRIIIGADSQKAKDIMSEIYTPYTMLSNRIIMMDTKSAEMTKYAANSFLAVKISFMNEIANLCEKVGADVEMVRRGLSSDSRIGNKFLFPGLGYGGSCFPKDVNALIKTGNDSNCDMNIIKSAAQVNQRQRLVFVNKIINRFGEDLSQKTFAIWGLAFKPNTDDIREAPSVTVIEELIKRGAKIQAYDPKAMANIKNILGNKIDYSENMYSVLNGADALLLLTEWNEFRRPDFNKIKSSLKSSIIFDGRNQYSRTVLKEIGFEYHCMGRK